MKTKIPNKFPADSIKELGTFAKALSLIKGLTLEICALGTTAGLILNKGNHFQLACACYLCFALMYLVKILLDYYGAKTTKQKRKEKSSP